MARSLLNTKQGLKCVMREVIGVLQCYFFSVFSQEEYSQQEMQEVVDIAMCIAMKQGLIHAITKEMIRDKKLRADAIQLSLVRILHHRLVIQHKAQGLDAQLAAKEASSKLQEMRVDGTLDLQAEMAMLDKLDGIRVIKKEGQWLAAEKKNN